MDPYAATTGSAIIQHDDSVYQTINVTSQKYHANQLVQQYGTMVRLQPPSPSKVWTGTQRMRCQRCEGGHGLPGHKSSLLLVAVYAAAAAAAADEGSDAVSVRFRRNVDSHCFARHGDTGQTHRSRHTSSNYRSRLTRLFLFFPLFLLLCPLLRLVLPALPYQRHRVAAHHPRRPHQVHVGRR